MSSNPRHPLPMLEFSRQSDSSTSCTAGDQAQYL
jgi:hypothetical protein